MEPIGGMEGLDTMRISNASGRLEGLKKSKGLSRAREAQIDEAAQEFEAQFIAQMMENMFATVEVNPETGGGSAEEIYRSLLVNEYGKLIARTGGVGVADHVKREMIKLQEVEQ
jgi:peptidoglycan hydrolase FlgJ